MFDTLGHYKILDRIGGVAAVYRARDTRLGRTVAIKVPADAVVNDPARRDRLLREARAAAALSHPNIAALYEIGEDRGHLFLAFEFVPGETLAAVIGGRPINPRRALDLGAQLADAIAEAHAAAIVHGDIRPANVIVTPKGNAKILDFGLTKPPGASGDTGYLSPEQIAGEAADHRSDIFSVAACVFEMLTGTAPGASARPQPLPSPVDAFLQKALAREPDRRYQSAAMFAADLREAASTIARSDLERPMPVAARRAPRRNLFWLSLLLIVSAAAVGWLFRQDVLGAFQSLMPSR